MNSLSEPPLIADAEAAAYYGYGSDTHDDTDSDDVDDNDDEGREYVSPSLERRSFVKLQDSPMEAVQPPVFFLRREHRERVCFVTHPADAVKVNCFDDPPMPPDRLARKQRPFSRRGGFCHSVLLKSAVMASMSIADEEDGNTFGGRNTNNMCRFDSGTSSIVSMQESLFQDGPSSPRKRPRMHVTRNDSSRSGLNGGSEHTVGEKTFVDSITISRASELMGNISLTGNGSSHDSDEVSVSRGNGLIRRVSRRKSYESRVSEGADYDQDEDEP